MGALEQDFAGKNLTFEEMFLNVITTAVENAIENTVGPRLDAIETALANLALNTDKRFKEVNKRFEAMDRRFGKVDKRFDEVNKGDYILGLTTPCRTC